MKQVIDRSGQKIQGLFKKSDGSMVLIDPEGLRKHRLMSKHAESVQKELDTLRAQVKIILENLNK